MMPSLLPYIRRGKQTLNGFATQQVLFENLSHICFGKTSIHNTFRVNHRAWPHAARPQTTCRCYRHLGKALALLPLVHEFIDYFCAPFLSAGAARMSGGSILGTNKNVSRWSRHD